MRKQIWDDGAFVRWVQQGTQQQGLTLREVLHAAGVNRFYLKQAREGRSTNIVLNIAEILHTSPAALFGLPDSPQFDEAFRAWRRLLRQLPELNEVRNERLKYTARIIATQLATWVHIASDREDSDPVVLFNLVLGELNDRHASAKSPSEEASEEAASDQAVS